MRRLIVDGYNLLHGTPRYAALMSRDIDAAREQLIADLGARVADGQAVTVVFDGGANPFSDGASTLIGGVTVIFSAAGTEADTVIESLAAAAREADEELEVVTTDAATRWTSVGGTVTVTRSSTFARDLEEDEQGWREIEDAPRARRTVSERVSEEIRAQLDRLVGRNPRPS